MSFGVAAERSPVSPGELVVVANLDMGTFEAVETDDPKGQATALGATVWVEPSIPQAAALFPAVASRLTSGDNSPSHACTTCRHRAVCSIALAVDSCPEAAPVISGCGAYE